MVYGSKYRQRNFIAHYKQHQKILKKILRKMFKCFFYIEETKNYWLP